MGENRGKNPTEKTKMMLCAAAAGRCEFEGCNKFLFEEELTLIPLNISQIAHNIASSPAGPRGDIILSHKVSNDLENLLLLCAKHHKLVDDNPACYPVERLKLMKKKHEAEIHRLCELMYYPECITVRLQSPIKGKIPVTIDQREVNNVIASKYKPQDKFGPLIEIIISEPYDTKNFWSYADKEIERQYNIKILPLLDNKTVCHVAVFPLAPIPMIIKLGYLIGDKIPVHVYQKFRSTNNWQWLNNSTEPNFSIKKVVRNGSNPKRIAIIFSISAHIDASRIPESEDIFYHFTVDNPNVEVIRSENDLNQFKLKYLFLLDRIKTEYPKLNVLDIFCAVPSSVAFEIGNSYMQGVYPKIRIFDDNNGFFETLTIGGDNDAD